MTITFDQTTPSWDSWTGLTSGGLIPRPTSGEPITLCSLSHDGWLCSLPAGHLGRRHLAGGSEGQVFHAWPGTNEPVPADLLRVVCVTCGLGVDGPRACGCQTQPDADGVDVR
jgi:hypothetical protein